MIFASKWIVSFQEILREIDTTLTEDDLDNIIEEVDEDGSGTLDFDEFQEMMMGWGGYNNCMYFMANVLHMMMFIIDIQMTGLWQAILQTRRWRHVRINLD